MRADFPNRADHAVARTGECGLRTGGASVMLQRSTDNGAECSPAGSALPEHKNGAQCQPSLRIAALLPLWHHWSRQVMRGVSAFVKENPSWSLQWFPYPATKLAELRDWKPDGLLAFCETEQHAHDLSAICGFTVAVKSPIECRKMPSVTIDHRAVGRMAADHLASRGLKNFACLSLKDCRYGEPRAAGFRGFLADDQRRRCTRFWHQAELGDHGLRLRENTAFCDWLARAEKPIGLFAVEDRLGFEACEVCRELGLRVPDDVAVVGADDDESLCQISQPALSSVHTPLVQVGFEAATILKSMVDGQDVTTETRLLDPIQVTTRETCGTLSSDDPYVAEVLRRIHGNSGQPTTIKQLVKDLPVSRRNLEQRFRMAIGRSPMEEVRRVCIERAVAMLMNTDEPIWQVAKTCGFGSPVHLSVAFRRARGVSPREFRDRFRVETRPDGCDK